MAEQVEAVRTVRVRFCANDPSNGMPLFRVSAVAIGSEIEASIVRGCEPAISFGDSELTFLRRKWAFSDYQDWAENWCWCVVRMEVEAAKRLIRAMCADRRFELESGPASVFRQWEALREKAAAKTAVAHA